MDVLLRKTTFQSGVSLFSFPVNPLPTLFYFRGLPEETPKFFEGEFFERHGRFASSRAWKRSNGDALFKARIKTFESCSQESLDVLFRASYFDCGRRRETTSANTLIFVAPRSWSESPTTLEDSKNIRSPRGLPKVFRCSLKYLNFEFILEQSFSTGAPRDLCVPRRTFRVPRPDFLRSSGVPWADLLFASSKSM